MLTYTYHPEHDNYLVDFPTCVDGCIAFDTEQDAKAFCQSQNGINGLRDSAQAVVDSLETGDLAAAVRRLEATICNPGPDGLERDSTALVEDIEGQIRAFLNTPHTKCWQDDCCAGPALNLLREIQAQCQGVVGEPEDAAGGAK